MIVDQDERERIDPQGRGGSGHKGRADAAPRRRSGGRECGPDRMAGAAARRFDPEFLDVPREVIVLTMRTNQKYFACIER